jgi:tRNA (uracil-5-)-methyltransferase TRM9
VIVDPSWEEPDRVDHFATRPPDHRLVALVASEPDPRGLRVLDLGCAGGRNTVFLAEHGADVDATDGSRAMVERTRERLAEILGPDDAARRVHHGPMHALPWAKDAAYDLVVALGIYHNARSTEEWQASLAETARVLRPGGRCLVSTFTPETDLEGEGKVAVPGVPHLYERPGGRRLYLVDPANLDADMARLGLEPIEPTVPAEGKVPAGRRVSINGLYRRTER